MENEPPNPLAPPFPIEVKSSSIWGENGSDFVHNTDKREEGRLSLESAQHRGGGGNQEGEQAYQKCFKTKTWSPFISSLIL